MASVMTPDAPTDPAFERVLATIDDEDLAARYPSPVHFVSANDPDQAQIAIRALSDGDPVVIVYQDGHELLIRPDSAVGVQIEERDASGRPIAA
jgi:hypothetical protein